MGLGPAHLEDLDFRDLFPRTKFRFSPNDQCDVMLKEVEEVRGAVFQTRDELLKECVDVLQATFSLIYNEGYTNPEILKAIRDVQVKNRKRGYYE